MSDAYDFRPGGSLKLKGGGEKKKKHKSSSQTSSKKAIIGDELVAKSKPVETKSESPAPPGSRHESPAGTSSNNPSSSKKTPAEVRFEETQRKRRLDRVAKLASKTHKDRVHEFNAKLESLSEHHDIPKVGPG
ncbi:Protein FAM32A [Ceratobasidium theobromae]|uniref:Protein FAM32A n=1 Tax=Ceratobasidium theobromae TaxID=1582974 RepID=A0A5N5QJ76_9AGAM|nr:Protein FAM32A [Ceratobasidium theobromae]